MPNAQEQDTIETLILIVGGGPTGLLLAHLLSKFGIKSLLIEKYPTRLGAPKAHALNPRSLEICRQFGLDTTALRKLGTNRADAYWVNFCTNLTRERIGVLPYERMDTQVLEVTPEMIHNIPQPEFEKFVAKVLAEDDNVEVRTGVEFVSCVQDANGVVSTLEERETKKRYCVRSRQVVGCDGAKSSVRESLGIQSGGEDSYETMMTIHFNADLRPVVGKHVGMLHWITDPAASGFIIGYDLSCNQVLITNFDPDKHPVESWNEDLCRRTVNAAIGQEIPFDVLSYRPWVLSRKVAEQYHQGNVFLAGDAAHSFPPTGGLGLNCGIADVHNLACKLAAVHQGWAGQSLLDTYGKERRPVANIYSMQSVENGKKIFAFLKMLGTAGIEDIEEARSNLYKTVSDPSRQEMIQEHIEGQRTHFDNLGLHIGYEYGYEGSQGDPSHYPAQFGPGSRLHHAWIRLRRPDLMSLKPVDVSYVPELTGEQINTFQYSILDLCAPDAFTLIVGSRDQWIPRFEALQTMPSMAGLKLNLYAADTDFEFLDNPQEMVFRWESRLQKGYGLLIRPDQHILVRLMEWNSAEDVEAELREYLCI